MQEIIETLHVPVRYSCDVCVCGGGIAGIAAALAARRGGAEVLLLEREYLLGGLATAGMITIFLPICDGKGHQVSFGLAEELLRLSIKHGAEYHYPAHWMEPFDVKTRAENERFEVHYNPYLFAIEAERLLIAEGVKILYGVTVAAAHVEDGKIRVSARWREQDRIAGSGRCGQAGPDLHGTLRKRHGHRNVEILSGVRFQFERGTLRHRGGVRPYRNRHVAEGERGAVRHREIKERHL